MSASEIKVDLGTTLTRFTNMVTNLEDTDELTSEISEIILSDIGQHFEDEVGPNDEPWLELAPATIEDREKENKWPGKILQRQGRGSGLLGSLQEYSTKTEAGVSTNKVYAAIHHFGGQAGRGKKVTIPARPWAYLSSEATEEIKDAILNHVDK
ncbi:MAG: phage virion morphogenesis protein [Balneola sp.]